MAASNRSFVSGRFVLELDGAGVGFLKSVDGGGVSAQVITSTLGQDIFATKHIGPPRYEDFALQFGFNLSEAVYKWIGKAWTGNIQPQNGSVIATDNNRRVKSRRDFSGALITETTIPAMDASARDAALLSLKFASEITRLQNAAGGVIAAPAKEKQFLPSNFKLEIDGLDCTKVSRIEPFTVKTKVVTGDTGNRPGLQPEPGEVEFPNLKISISEVGAQSWLDWCEDFIISGNNSPAQEKNGALILLSANRRDELARITFFHLGIFRLAPEKVEAGSDIVRRITAELYCERMEFEVG